MDLSRVQIALGGPDLTGAGVMTLYFDATTQAVPNVAAIKSALSAAAIIFPTALQFTVPNSGDIIHAADGLLVGSWTGSGGGTVGGGGGGSAPQGVGACIGWSTDAIVKGRRLRGRTFLVPMSQGVFDGNGLPTGQVTSSGTTLANALIASGPLTIWHRPTTKGGTDGSGGHVTSARVRQHGAFLGSRRD